MTAETPAGPARLEGIQYLRGFAALGVVLDHSAGVVTLPKYFGGELAGGMFEAGAYGVDVFFVISGFIIAIVGLRDMTLEPMARSGWFLLRRFARVVPLMWIAISSFAILRWAFSDAAIGAGPYWRAAFLLPFGTVEPAQIWTLRHELLFYGLFALSWLSGRGRWWLLAVWFASPAIAELAFPAVARAWTEEDIAGIAFADYNLEFAAGFLLGLAHLKRMLLPRWVLPVDPALVLFAGFTVFLTCAWFVLHNIDWFVAMCIVSLAAMLLVACARSFAGSAGMAGRLSALLGDASYSIYLFHMHFVSSAVVIAARIAGDMPPGVVVFGIVVLASAGGVVIHRLIERPLLAQLDRMLCVHR